MKEKLLKEKAYNQKAQLFPKRNLKTGECAENHGNGATPSIQDSDSAELIRTRNTGSGRHCLNSRQTSRKLDARMYSSILAATYVRKARESSGLSQKELAKALGVRPSRICDIEKRRFRKQGTKTVYDTVSIAFLYEVQVVTGRELILKAGREIPKDVVPEELNLA